MEGGIKSAPDPSSIACKLGYANEGVTTFRGDELLDEVGFATILKQSIGFTPAEVAERYDINRALRNRQERVQRARTTIARSVYDDIKEGGPISPETMAKITAFNTKNPTYRITPDYLRRSIRGRMAMTARNEFGVALNPLLNQVLRDGVRDTRYD